MKKHHPQSEYSVFGRIARNAASLAAICLAMGSAKAATINVNNLNDSGAGSLRQAMLDAMATPGNTVQAGGVSGTITLLSPLPLITNSISINGSGSGSLQINGNHQFRIFFVDAANGTVAISNLGILNGLGKGGNGGLGFGGGGGGLGAGGGLFVNSGNVTLSGVEFSGNGATGGNGSSTISNSGGSGGGGGFGADGGTGGYIAGGGGGGFAGRGGDAFTGGSLGGSGGGGGGIIGNGATGQTYIGGGGGGTVSASGQAGAGGGGNGGNNTNRGGNSAGQAGQTNGGGGGGGNGDLPPGYDGGSGGAGGKFGGGGGARDAGVGGQGGEFGGGGGSGAFGSYPSYLGYGGNGGWGAGGGGSIGQNSGGGGFGGGGGGARFSNGRGSPGAFGGLGGYDHFNYRGPGGGGGALGASVFVRADNGASLNWVDSQTDAGTLTPGTGGASAGSSQSSAGGSGGAAGTSLFLLGGTTTFTIQSGTTTIPGTIANWYVSPAGLTKEGPGTLILSANNSYYGPTIVNVGELKVTGNISTSSGMAVNNGGIISGSGVFPAMTINSGGTIAPGNSPGTLTAGGTAWTGSGNYNWQIANATAAAGTGYDLFQVNGTLNLSGASGFKINLWSLSGINPDANGNALNFNNLISQSWNIVQTTGGIVGFNAANFTIVTSPSNGTAGFSNPTLGGTFGLVVTGNNLVLKFFPAVNNADLSNLSFSTGNVYPAFSTAVTSYNISLPTTTTTFSVSPSVVFPQATTTVRINGGAYVASNSALALNVGNNTVDVKVVSADTTVTKIYTINVERRAGAFVNVSNGADAGVGSLRQGMLDAAPGETINLPSSGTISLTSGEILINNKSINIVGPGADKLTISANGNSRIFNFNAIGGCVWNVSGVRLSQGTQAIYTGGSGYYGTLNISACIFDSNTSGAIYSDAEILNVDKSTFSGNSGGAIYSRGHGTIKNSTFSGNSGGAYLTEPNNNNAVNKLIHCTITANSGGAVQQLDSAPIILQNCLIAGNTGGDLQGSFSSLGGNVIGTSANSSGMTSGYLRDQVGSNAALIIPKLGPLQNNGGTTATHALLEGSPAINASDLIAGLELDQRGETRGQGSFADAGSYELLNIDEVILAQVTVLANASPIGLATQTSVDSVQTGVNNVQTSVTGVQSAVTGVQSTVNSVQTSLGSVQSTVSSKLDATVGSRATQTSVDAIGTTVNNIFVTGASQSSINTLSNNVSTINSKVNSTLDTNLSSRASQSTVNTLSNTVAGVSNIVAAVNASTSADLDTNILSRASQSSVNTVSNNLAGVTTSLTTLSNIVSFKASQTSVDNVGASVTAVSGTLATKASQASVDNANASLTGLKSDVLSRANQTSVDAANSSLSSVASTLATKSSQASVDAGNTSLAAAHAKLDARLHTNVLSRASQTSLDAGITLIGTKVDNAKTSITASVDNSSATQTANSAALAAANAAGFSGVNTGVASLSTQLTSHHADLTSTVNTGVASVLGGVSSAQAATQSGLNDLTTNTLATLNSNVLTRASQASLDAGVTSIISKVDDTKTALSAAIDSSTAVTAGNVANSAAANAAGFGSVNTGLGSLATQIATHHSDVSSAVNSGVSSVLAGVNSSQAATQAGLQDLTTNTLATLTSNVLNRASQVSLDTGINTLSNKVSDTGSTLASQVQATTTGLTSTIAAAESADQASFSSIFGKLALTLDTNVLSRASQSSVDDLKTNTLAGISANLNALSLQLGNNGSGISAQLSQSTAALSNQLAATTAALNSAVTSSGAALGLQLGATRSDILAANGASQAAVTALVGSSKTEVLNAVSASQSAVATQLATTRSDVLSGVSSAQTSLASQLGTTRTDVLGTVNSSTTLLLGTLNTMQTATGTGLATANSQLDVKSSTRASQISVDAANAKLAVGLDTNMLSRASQTSLNVVSTNLNILTTNLDVSVDLLLRAKIEQHLTDGIARVSMFYLPAAQGGHLEFVRDIVNDVIARNAAVGITSSKTAGYMATAASAYTAQNYKLAYDQYKLAYQAIVK